MTCIGSKIVDLDDTKMFRNSSVEDRSCTKLPLIIFATPKRTSWLITLVLQERYNVEASADDVILIITLAQTMLVAGATIGSVSVHLWLRFMRFAFFSSKQQKVTINVL